MKDRIDPLILDRAPWLATPGISSSLATVFLRRALSYDATIAVAEALRDRDAGDIMRTLGKRLARDCTVDGLSNLPRHGAAIILANHPTGIADGIILGHVLSQVRDDTYFFANRDVLRVLPQLDTLIAPVEWRHERRSRDSTRDTLRFLRHAVCDERLGVIFPSGRLAKRRGLRLYERPWMPSAAAIARKFDLPIIPVHIKARNSALFYLLDALHPTLRDVTLFHETLNKDKQHFDITIGAQIRPQLLPSDPAAATEDLRQQTLSLGETPLSLAPHRPRPWRKPAITV